ncbi:choice-of-anchor M domain-containing protein [Sanguibacter suaedae]|uniref:Choice-of-anchor M domain-containing protein n=1 Tax=Sanguibacter suaedae TaxID=2795737 RepID=A0A934I923_9MICO|nr:choice-of-anchor M domain-containing protein [Sanguibacter suaedae]MBI9113631.1 choice-of-anchor M domain-containing protein [Sanguibacter suaedae]
MSPSPSRRTARPSARRTAVVTVLAAATLALPPAAAGSTLVADTDGVPGEQAVISDGHVDVGPRFVDGEWTLQARDDREVPPVWRDMEDTVVHVLDTARLEAPGSPEYAFLGVAEGDPLYLVPQVQDQAVAWLGWNTQDPEVTQRVDLGATLRLDGVEGPGELHLFLQEGVSGTPNVLWTTADDDPQELWMEVNTHTHANWVFTEPGAYVVDVTVLADLTDGEQVEDSARMLFAVGTDTDPQEAFAAAEAAGDLAEDTGDAEGTEDSDGGDGTDGATGTGDQATPDTAPDTEAAPEESGTGPSPWAIGAAAAVLALLVALGATVVRSRRARAAAEADADADSATTTTGRTGGPAGDAS